MTTIINGSSPSITFSDGSAQTSATRPFQNRIINGAMVIDQRNAGASVTVNSTANSFITDRFVCQGQSADGVFTGQQVSDAPAGFTNSIRLTVTTADSSIGSTQFYFLSQRIEGFNVADLGFGAVGASTVTLSFWAKSSVTGTFGGSLSNDAVDRSYPFTYVITSANTWEYKTVTITGDTTGTWVKNNGLGMRVYWNLGAGSSYTASAGAWASQWAFNATGANNLIATNGATLAITGVQLEAGSTATSFEYRPFGTELALCQRYYYKQKATAVNSNFSLGYNTDTTNTRQTTFFPTSLRAAPTAIETTGTASDYLIANANGNPVLTSVPSFSSADIFSASFAGVVASGLTAGQAAALRSATSSAYLAWSAEL